MTEQERRETEKNQYFESEHRKRRAQLLSRPHLVYGARVWRTQLKEEGKEWACGLVYDGAMLPYCGTVQVFQVETQWGWAYPVAFGVTPEEATVAFDKLWYEGDKGTP
jgi:hypothetical protein